MEWSSTSTPDRHRSGSRTCSGASGRTVATGDVHIVVGTPGVPDYSTAPSPDPPGPARASTRTPSEPQRDAAATAAHGTTPHPAPSSSTATSNARRASVDLVLTGDGCTAARRQWSTSRRPPGTTSCTVSPDRAPPARTERVRRPMDAARHAHDDHPGCQWAVQTTSGQPTVSSG